MVALEVKSLPADAGDIRDADLVPGWEICPRGGNGSLLQCSYLENPIDRSLVGYSPWGHKESGMTEVTSQTCMHKHMYICLLSLEPFFTSAFHPSRLSPSPRLGSLCYTAASRLQSIVHVRVYICQCCFLSLSYTLLPAVSTRSFSMSVSPFLLLNRFIRTVFLDSIYQVFIWRPCFNFSFKCSLDSSYFISN